jgi:hypothetical protein
VGFTDLYRAVPLLTYIRLCPGRYLALNGLWIMAASMIAVFDIYKDLDKNGEPIEPKVEYTDGTTR